ncbi:MAG: hypothetical protein AAF196_19345 [Planctomycetota bacterium]
MTTTETLVNPERGPTGPWLRFSLSAALLWAVGVLLPLACVLELQDLSIDDFSKSRAWNRAIRTIYLVGASSVFLATTLFLFVNTSRFRRSARWNALGGISLGFATFPGLLTVVGALVEWGRLVLSTKPREVPVDATTLACAIIVYRISFRRFDRTVRYQDQSRLAAYAMILGYLALPGAFLFVLGLRLWSK